MACPKHPRYLSGCTPCRTYAVRYDKRRRTAVAAGTWLGMQPIAETQAHISHLIAGGMTLADIARTAGVSYTTLLAIHHGLRSTVQGPNARAILAVQLAPSTVNAPPRMLSAVASTRRVQALIRLGRNLKTIANVSGASYCSVYRLAHAENTYVDPDIDQRIGNLYERERATWAQAGYPDILPDGDLRAHRMACRHGWPDPNGWDDDTIGDPTARPYIDQPTVRKRLGYDVANVHLALHGAATADELTTAERIETVEILVTRRWSDLRIAGWLAWGSADGRAVAAFRSRHNISSGFDPETAQALRRQLANVA